MAEQTVAGRSGPPRVVQVAGVLVAIEGVIAGAAAIMAFVRVVDSGRHGNYGIAVCLVLLTGSVLVAGIELVRGRWWPRTVAVIAQVLLLMMTWYMFTWNQPQLAVPLGAVALTILVLLFSPPSNRWMAVPFDLRPEPRG